MSNNPCQICGCTELNLVDGFYYCVECGTQDVNVRETIIETNVQTDSTFIFKDTKKFSTVVKDDVQMSGEWHKWHAYNFILASLADELIAVGAKPTVKMKVLWIWVRYIKKFQQKNEPEVTQFENKSLDGEDEEESENEENIDINEENIDINESECSKTKKTQKTAHDINNVTKGVLLAILHVALNLDKSHIQLIHLFQFIREGRLSLYNCTKFVPKELSVKLIPNWYNFNLCTKEYTNNTIRAYGMTIFKRLNLGVPLVPDLNKIVSNFIKELCLPKDFMDLVLSLFEMMPCDFLQINVHSLKSYIYIPDYETVCMSYVLLALKMCFGLDCDYEIKLSDAVNKINHDEDYLKSYKLGIYSEPTDRLFSFQEWYRFIQFRKIILCKHYLPMARQFNLSVDDCVFMEHSEERRKIKTKLSYEVTMDILNKIPVDETTVIPKKDFPATLTPMTTYTEVLLKHVNDPDLKLHLCEDFTQYSLKYATRDLKLPGYENSLLNGVDNTNKIINSNIIGKLTSKTGDPTIVLVRNCENKNWLKTKPPKLKHVTEKITDRVYGCDSSSDDSGGSEDEHSTVCDADKDICEEIDEEDEEICIFDDNFKNLQIDDDNKKSLTAIEESNTLTFHNKNFFDSNSFIHDTLSESSTQEVVFNPDTFDREQVIQELIEIACQKHKIRLPKEKEKSMPRKRKNVENNEAGVSRPKKIKNTDTQRGEAKKVTQGLIDAYYNNIYNDELLKVSEHLRSAIEMAEMQEEFNALNRDVEETDVQNSLNNPVREIDAQHQNDNKENFGNDDNQYVIESSFQDASENGSVDEENNIEELLPKTNPKFDPKTHDIKQLYVNVKEELNLRDIAKIDIDDPDIDHIIDKKIAEFQDYDENDEQLVKPNDSNDSTDSDDDIPLALILEDKLYCMRSKDRSNLDYLVKEKEIKNFRYWMRHYKSKGFSASNSFNQKFNEELMENFPISFNFVIRECAAVAECSAFNLYKCFQKLEERLKSCIETI